MNKFQHQGAELRNRAKELALSLKLTQMPKKTATALSKLRYFV